MKKTMQKQKWEYSRKIHINRKHKDVLFRIIFRSKEDLLDLYNAVNHTAYDNPEDLQITTMQDAVYVGIKNDLSFLIANVLNLYEHQSTYNPNMPLRGLLYFADMLRAYVEGNDLNIYGSKLLKLPVPVYLIFYNGTEEMPDQMDLKLSDAFDCVGHAGAKQQEPALECRARLLNINLGHNRELMEHCTRLADYAYFVEQVRNNLEQGMSLRKAADRAVEDCIEQGKLADILIKNRNEVINMLFTKYDKKWHMGVVRKEAREEGYEEGAERVNQLNQKLLEDNRTEDLKRSVRDKAFQEQLFKEYGI